MSDPRRLCDESTDALELALLRAGSRGSASPELREKTLAALGLGGAVVASGALGSAAALAAGASGKGAGGLLSALSFKVTALMLGVAASVAAPVYFLTGDAAAPPARLAKPRGVLAGPVVREARPAPARPAQAAPSASAPRAVPAGDAARTLSSPKLPPAEALRAELTQLDAARSRLASGRPEEALRILDGYARSAPQGRLKLEAEVLRIDALSKSGRSAQAKARAREFLGRHPNSVLAARVRRIAGE